MIILQNRAPRMLAFVLLLAGAPLHASHAADDFRRHVDEAVEFLGKSEYERSLERLRRARGVAHGKEQSVVIDIYEGILLAELLRWDEARASFKRALFLEPEAKLPPRVSPKIAGLFESVREHVRSTVASERREEQGRPERAPQLAGGTLKASIQVVIEAALPAQDCASGTCAATLALSPAPPSSAEREAEHRQPVAGAEAVQNQGQADAQAQQEVQPQEPLTTEAIPASPEAGEGSVRNRLRAHALLPAIAGGVLLVAGGGVWSQARYEQEWIHRGEPRTREEAQRSAERGRNWQTLGLGLVGAGVVGLGIATGFHVLGSSAEPGVHGMGTDGTSAFVYGRWW